MSQTSRLWDLLLVNSNPSKTKTGELILPCYTSTGRKFFEKRLADVRVVQVKPATSQQGRLEAITDMYPEVGRLVELMGLQVPAAKKSAASKKNK
jgi:hypothetical protein